MKKLSTDNPFFDFMGNIGDLIVLNVLFVITSIPVISMGVSLTALYQVVLRRQRGESNYVVREYFQAFKEEWKQSTVLWGIFLLTGGILLFDVFYVENMGSILAVVIGCMIAAWGFVFSYTFPLQARFQNTIKNTFKNALFLSVRHFPYTILAVGLNSIPVICIVAGTFITMMAMPIYCFLGFSLTAKINSIFFDRIFRDFITNVEENAEI